ncbi:MAG: hypothetical protein K6U10_14780 [Acidobacteriia bacterium]|nr:hypothetical protein [Methyloceanibacter sp.]MBX5471315.1 hypothetical protein [Acetobacteraceae bacterium]MCL6493067.1 hypothetical protein [Terriglobia bacterium]
MTPLSAAEALLLMAYQHAPTAPNAEEGVQELRRLLCDRFDADALHAAIADCLRRGEIRDPVRLPPGALQCHWHLQLSPKGVETVHRLLTERHAGAEQLLNTLRD